MPVRNPHLGEVELRNSGVRIVLTARAWVAIEVALKKSIMEILQDAANMSFGITEMHVIIAEGAEAYGRRNRLSTVPGDDEVYDLLDEYGLDLMEDVAAAISGSPALGVVETAAKSEGSEAPLG